MDEQQRIIAVDSSSNSSPIMFPKKNDVFISFLDEETCSHFTRCLFNALNRKSVKTYIDNQLKKGGEISPAFTEAIEDSHVSIVIFSRNYASSKWCLDELSKIMECRKFQGMMVVPVFYKVDPSLVTKQTGSYEQAFVKHEGEPRCSQWRANLTKAANLPGSKSRICWIQPVENGKTVEAPRQKLLPPQVVEDPPQKFIRLQKFFPPQKLPPRYPKKHDVFLSFRGEDTRLNFISHLYKALKDEKVKAYMDNQLEKGDEISPALTKAIEDSYISVVIFSENYASSKWCLGELSKILEWKKVQEQIVIPVFYNIDPTHVRHQTGSYEKAFAEHEGDPKCNKWKSDLKEAANLAGWDSIKRIETEFLEDIVEDVLKKSYVPKPATAFGQKQPKDGYKDLSRSVVSYCKGIPLALKVLGSSLYKKDESIWISELKKLGKIQNLEIHKVLRSSYDGLDPYEQDIFLDIACFFKGWHRDRLLSLLEAYGFYPVRGIDTLLDKSLITISDDNRIEMHDLIQEMGWKIVDKDIKDPGKRSRLWRHDEVLEVLEDNVVTRDVQGIIFYLCRLTRDLDLSSISPANMTNVRCLMIHDSSGRSNGFKVCLPDGESLLSNKLRCLHWDGFCLDSMPPTFRAKHLVELRMRDSKLKKLWDRVQDLVNLKTIDLSYSRNLIEIPDLSKADKLESVYLIDCESLCQLHVQSKSLCVVRLDGCSSLKEFSMTSVKITELNLDNTAICTFPSSVWCSTKLASLSLKGWKDLNFVVNIGYLSSLEELDLSGTNVMNIPKSFEKLSTLKRLRLDDCGKLKSLPELLPISLQEVSAVNCTSLDAEITQQLVLVHMSQNRLPGHFIFPGSHFVEDCEFRTTESSITIDCLPKSNFCGLIYCFILSKHGKGFRTIPVSYCICQDDIQIVRDDKAMACGSNLISDHVLFSYVDISRFDRISEVHNNFSVIFEFDHYDETIEFRHDQERIKGCGVFPVYATERGFNKLIGSKVEFFESELEALRMEMRRASTSQ